MQFIAIILISIDLLISSQLVDSSPSGHTTSASHTRRGSPVPGGLGDVLGSGLLAGGTNNHGDESLLHSTLNGVPEYDECAPPRGPIPPTTPGDAPFTQGQQSYADAVTCPHGIRNSPQGILLLVPCTSCDSEQTFAKSPFGIGLPEAGFDLCWLDFPKREMGDMQLSAEFVAASIKSLAPRSPATQYTISIVAYSQGCTNVQWALDFWPSARRLVHNYVAIAGLFKGTPVTAVVRPMHLLGGPQTSLHQLAHGSRYMRALNAPGSGGSALVRTTSIRTRQDDLVVPQTDGPSGASFLYGAAVIAIQDACPGAISDHFGLPVNAVVYGLAYDALIHHREASMQTFDRRFCGDLGGDLFRYAAGIPRYLELTLRTVVGNPTDRIGPTVKSLTTLSTTAEPKLQEYVCRRGFAQPGECTNGFCNGEQRQSLVKGLLGEGDTSVVNDAGSLGESLGPILGSLS